MNSKFNLLVTTDYSEAAEKAERYAIQFAKDTGSVLKFLHIFKPPLSSQLPPFDAEKIDYNPIAHEQNKLTEHVTKLMDSLNIRPAEVIFQCRVREGNITKQITEEAKEENTDFIIAGTHGASGFREVFMGSHTWSLIKNAGVPVLAVPPEAVYTKLNKIVFAAEYRDGEIPVINFVSQLSRRFDAEMTVLHITNYTLSKEFENETFENFREEVKSEINYEKLEIHLANYDDIIEGLNDFCQRTGASLLSMSPEKSGLLESVFFPSGSTTRKMSFHTRVPLLAIPDYNNPESEDFWQASERQNVSS